MNLYVYVLGYQPDTEALESGDDKDYNAILRAIKAARAQGRIEGVKEAAQHCREQADKPWICEEIAGYDKALREEAEDLDKLANQLEQPS